MTTISQAIDDTGSDTLRRYLYQAEITLLLCLELLPAEAVSAAVVPEYIEDICVEKHDSTLRLVQVKTRDATLGAWRSSHLLDADGAMRSALRSFRHCEQNGLNAWFELYLEGPAAPNEPNIQLLRSGAGASNKKFIAYVSERLTITVRIAAQFLQRVRVVSGLPPREAISAINQQRLGRLGEGLLFEEVIDLHDDLLTLILTAMCGRLESTAITLDELSLLTVDDRHIRSGKVITAGVLAAVLRGRIRLANRLSESLAIGESSSTVVTNLRFKLLQREASASTVMEATRLRLLAREWRDSMRFTAADVFKIRRVKVQRALLATVQRELDPGRHDNADAVFKAARDVIHRDHSLIDPGRAYDRNPNLLLGELCEVSDQCNFEWSATA